MEPARETCQLLPDQCSFLRHPDPLELANAAFGQENGTAGTDAGV
jgi:hypothetical protein